MIKTYSLKGTEFQTITIPKGTILFRGIHTSPEKRHDSLFTELIGHRKDKYHTIYPTLNSFFYPTPYVSDSVQIYGVHIMYIIQYPIELLLLLKPSPISRADKDNPKYKHIFRTCSDISEKDKCGYDMPDYDPCFTDIFMQRYPQIDGFIGIAEQDASYFLKKYKRMIENTPLNRVLHVIPSLLSDSRDIIAIPELVIHPLRFRHDECFTLRERLQQPSEIINYCTKFRAQYNYFPLLYFTNTSVYTFNDLKNKERTIEVIRENRVYNNTTPQIYENIEHTFSEMLRNGYKIGNTIYKIVVDTKTGFYKIQTDTQKKTEKRTLKRCNKNHNFADDLFHGRFNTTLNYNKIEQRYIPHNNYIDSFLHNLHINGLSAKKRLIVNRGDTNKLIYNYKIDKVIDRPELEPYREKRVQKNRKTQKNTNNRIRFMFDFDTNIDSMSDIEEILD